MSNMIINVEKVIRKNKNIIFNYISDFTMLDTWQKDFIDILFITPAPIKKGTYFLFTRKFFISKISHTYEVVEFIPSSKIRLKRVEPFKSEIVYSIEMVDNDISKVKIKETIELNGLMILFYPIIKLLKKIQLNKGLTNLSKLL